MNFKKLEVNWVMNFLQLKYFSAIARCGSVSKAARELYITQPTLSRSIAQLEEEIGVSLFDRNNGMIRINEYGRRFLASVNIAFNELESGVQNVRKMYDTNQNLVSLACSIDDFLPDMLIKFFHIHPEIGIRHFNYKYQVMIEQLLDRSLDIVFSSKTIKNDSIIFEVLSEVEYVLLLNKNHRLAKEGIVSLSKLKNEHFICDSFRFSKEMLEEICLKSGFRPVTTFEIESSELVYKLLNEGVGITIAPIPYYLNLNEKHPDNKMSCVYIREDIPKSIIGLAYHKDCEFSNAANTLITCIRKWLNEEYQQVKSIEL